jgi:flagellar biosynthesis component FlhA
MILLILTLYIITFATIPSLMWLHFIVAPILIFMGIDLQERLARRKLRKEEEKRKQQRRRRNRP